MLILYPKSQKKCKKFIDFKGFSGFWKILWFLGFQEINERAKISRIGHRRLDAAHFQFFIILTVEVFKNEKLIANNQIVSPRFSEGTPNSKKCQTMVNKIGRFHRFQKFPNDFEDFTVWKNF